MTVNCANGVDTRPDVEDALLWVIRDDRADRDQVRLWNRAMRGVHRAYRRRRQRSWDIPPPRCRDVRSRR